jgi:hypothetical protein
MSIPPLPCCHNEKNKKFQVSSTPLETLAKRAAVSATVIDGPLQAQKRQAGDGRRYEPPKHSLRPARCELGQLAVRFRRVARAGFWGFRRKHLFLTAFNGL